LNVIHDPQKNILFLLLRGSGKFISRKFKVSVENFHLISNLFGAQFIAKNVFRSSTLRLEFHQFSAREINEAGEVTRVFWSHVALVSFLLDFLDDK
jgi:hypothetical protein